MTPTSAIWTIEAIGWAGALLFLASYFLVSTGRVTGQSPLFHWLNVAGAASFVINTAWHGALPSMVVNAIWVGIGLVALWKLNRAVVISFSRGKRREGQLSAPLQPGEDPMLKIPAVLAATALALIASPISAKRTPANPQVDYAGFAALTSDLAKVRRTHRLGWAEFSRRAAAEGALLLDARSADAFARGHLKGAVNLPFTDFTDDALRAVIGSNTRRPIYIYCNNNFRDHANPVPLKRTQMALNIPTFINLHGYGYRNVWELADVIGMRDAGVEWEASPRL